MNEEEEVLNVNHETDHRVLGRIRGRHAAYQEVIIMLYFVHRYGTDSYK